MKKNKIIFSMFIVSGVASQSMLAKTSTVQNNAQPQQMTTQEPLQIVGTQSAVLFKGTNTWTKAKVTGMFSNIQGQVIYDKTNVAKSKVRLRIPVKSLKTQKADVKNKRFKKVSDENLANYMKSKNFFGLYQKKGSKKVINPQGRYIKFTSTSIQAMAGSSEKQQLNICGILTIRGKRKPNQCFVGTLENTTFKGSPAKRFVGKTIVDRNYFGVGKGWMTFTIGNNVDIQMNILLHEKNSIASQQQSSLK